MLLDKDAINEIVWSESDNEDFDLVALSYQKPTMLIFLRHFGCTFCREALSDMSKEQDKIKNLDIEFVFVHMVDKESADFHLGVNNLLGSLNISDPNRLLYQHFGLQRGNFRQLFGLNVMMRGFSAGVVNGHGHGMKFIGDGDQMPGLFMLYKGRIISRFLHKYASDRPNYLEFAELAIAKKDAREANDD